MREETIQGGQRGIQKVKEREEKGQKRGICEKDRLGNKEGKVEEK